MNTAVHKAHDVQASSICIFFSCVLSARFHFIHMSITFRSSRDVIFPWTKKLCFRSLSRTPDLWRTSFIAGFLHLIQIWSPLCSLAPSVACSHFPCMLAHFKVWGAYCVSPWCPRSWMWCKNRPVSEALLKSPIGKKKKKNRTWHIENRRAYNTIQRHFSPATWLAA